MSYLLSPAISRSLAIAAIAVTAACSDSNNSAPEPDPVVTTPPAPAPEPITNATFEVSVVNLTLGQPLSPIAAVVHDGEFRAFTIGEAATDGLELLAEEGDNSGFLEEASGRAEASGEAPVGPGASDALLLELDGDDVSNAALTVMTMLVNTNDAIAGVNNLDLSALAVGDSVVVNSIAYDAGTEANTELAGTIPGPADGGEGFSSTRDDVSDQVTMHGGVVTGSDGLATSVLSEIHRFDNPVLRLRVTRMQ
ncbi:MAG: spondin domain-containing protein [Pseudomonadota bacterium]